MARLRYLLKNANLLNLALVMTLAYLVKSIVLPYFSDGVTYTPPVVKKEAAAAPAKPAEPKGPSPFDYVIIGEQNLFHPERKIPLPKVEAPPLPKPDFVLYGTMETAEFSLAYMEDKKAPRTTQGRGKRVTTLKLGDSLSGFVLKDVDVDKVVMLRGDETMVVHLNERGKVRETNGAVTGAPGTAQQAPQRPPVTPAPSAVAAPPGVAAPLPQGNTAPTTPLVQPVRPPRRGLFGTRP